ncbi:MAG: tRNA lysidine(34) synthetase TilS [Rhizobacter sp.]|nr:tRNA lysidine(34) synthetase TilS [Rhizobacter sp.]
MAATPTPATAESSHCIAVAYSAGRDSTALLHATALAAAGQGVQVVALHVHHGLSPHADDWLAHAQAQCTRWAQQGLPLRLLTHRLTERPPAGDSIEAWARQARYRALRHMAIEAGAHIVLLAHHQRDQAETLLLQALRGAGVAGLAGMPREVERDGITWLRPWLSHPREAIEAYVRRHRLRYVDDDSNEDARFARNRLRLRVWPALSQAFPQAEASLADAATWAGEALACLAELALMDMALVSTEAGLNIKSWRGLSEARQTQVLRAWLKAVSGRSAAASLVQRLAHELPGTGPAQWELPGGVLRRHRGRLLFTADAPVPVVDAARQSSLRILRAGRFAPAGWGGELVATRVKEGGVPLAWLAHLELRPREGGEQFQAGIGRPARSLKKQYQDVGIPDWERKGPLVYSGGQLVFVPGLGVDARVLALPGQPQLILHWRSG